MRGTLAGHASFVAIEAVIVTALVAPVGGQLYSSFAFDMVASGNGSDGVLVVTNNGWFQASGLLLSGTVPGARPIGGDGGVACAEGRVVVADNGVVRAEFDRMTPGIQCQLAAVDAAAAADLSGIVITADRFTGAWTVNHAELPSKIAALVVSWWSLVLVALVASQILILYTIYNVFTSMVGVLVGVYWKRSEKRKSNPRATNSIIDYIRKEYGIVPSCDEGAILVLLICGKDTLEQIGCHTGMRRSHIRHLIKRLRGRHLVDPVRIAPIPSLCFLAGINGVCDDVHTKYDPCP